ncbi:MAG TPA: COX15/CtaA family protein [Anaeromyxobacter sp.]
MRAFSRFAWGVLAYNLAVVAWGALVRATGAGAGCGRHWPTCQGEVLPELTSLHTRIEFTHRAMSGLALVSAVVLAAWALRAFPRGHAVRKAALASVAFMIAEALVGAGLVIYGWVAKDTSPARGWVMAIHLTNTFLLLAALALTAWWSGRRPAGLAAPPRGVLGPLLAAAFAAMLLAGITGAIAALGDTLFPATSFADGLRQELSSDAALLLRLRVLHPVAAIAAAVLLVLAARAALGARPEPAVRGAAVAVATLAAAELLAGGVNLALLAPVWMQLVHLALADLAWIALVVLAASSLAPEAALEKERPGARPGLASFASRAS